MELLKVFLVGGIICAIGQILIDKTGMMSGRILVLYVCAGCILGALGIYKPIVDFGSAGATVPLTGFGYNLSKGVIEEIDKIGFLGIFTGGVKSAAGGLSAVMLFGFLASLVFSSKEKV